MTWILVAYLLLLGLFTFKPERAPSEFALRKAWTWVALIGISHAVFALFRAGNYRNPNDLMLAGIWEDGVGWLLLGLSMLALASGLSGKRPL